MHPKDSVFFALCLALSAMGFVISNLMWGLWFNAAFAAGGSASSRDRCSRMS